MPSSAPVSLLLTLLLAVLCCCTPAACSPAFSFVRSVQYSVGAEPWQTYNQTEFVFHQQRVDHFSLTNRSTYAQRFFVIDQFVQSPTTAPVLYNLCGEYTCPGIRSTRLYPLQLAYELHALVVIVEHRYYGASYPTPPTTANYVLLNSRQALEDFAFFQQWYTPYTTSHSRTPLPRMSPPLCPPVSHLLPPRVSPQVPAGAHRPAARGPGRQPLACDRGQLSRGAFRVVPRQVPAPRGGLAGQQCGGGGHPRLPSVRRAGRAQRGTHLRRRSPQRQPPHSCLTPHTPPTLPQLNPPSLLVRPCVCRPLRWWRLRYRV